MPVTWETEVNALNLGRNQESIGDGGLQLVGIGRHARFQTKERIRVSVDLVAGRCSEANQQ